jgi:hypothetical protein
MVSMSDDVAGPSEPVPGAESHLRPPRDGECELCGCVPATRATFNSVTSFVIFYSIGTRSAYLCRSCGLATYRDLVSRTLVRGWWGVGLFGVPVILLMNWIRLLRVLRLQPPQGRPPEVAPVIPAPLDPGRRVLARGSGIFALCLCGLLVLLVLAGMTSGS